jgi:protein-S-isoprenylcysteine O-methyltransferase Ste14
MSRTQATPRTAAPARQRTTLMDLVGSGHKIALFTLPFAAAAVLVDLVEPQFFAISHPSAALQAASGVALLAGLVTWAWSVVLILRKVPRRELITTGPYTVVKHPLYTGAALLVLPWLGFLLNTWLGAAIGIVLYVASRIFAPVEEVELAQTFGGVWDAYTAEEKLPWL